MTWYNKVVGATASGNLSNKFILYTDYNYISIDTTLSIPDRSIIEKNVIEKHRHANWEKKILEYHSCILSEHYKNFKIEKEPIVDQTALSCDIFENNNFKIVNRFSSILFMKYIKENVLFVLENDWNKILKSFTTAVTHLKYGY